MSFERVAEHEILRDSVREFFARELTEERIESIRLVHRLAGQLGLSCLFTEHDMAVVFAVANRITVMHQGKVLAEGTPAEVRARREVQQVYLGEAA